MTRLEVLKCSTCDKELKSDMEIEHCRETGSDYFCNPDCAAAFYFEYMQSQNVDLTDKDDLKENGIRIKNGKLYRIE